MKIRKVSLVVQSVAFLAVIRYKGVCADYKATQRKLNLEDQESSVEALLTALTFRRPSDILTEYIVVAFLP